MSVGGGGGGVGGTRDVQISFDPQNRIRILDAEQFKSTESLAEECNTFTNSKQLTEMIETESEERQARERERREEGGSRRAETSSQRKKKPTERRKRKKKQPEEIGQFDKTVESLVEVLTAQADKIEKQKLMAIGLRNKVESETETRKRRQQELQAEINQKQSELERFLAQLESLQKAESEQKALVEKLTKVE